MNPTLWLTCWLLCVSSPVAQATDDPSEGRPLSRDQQLVVAAFDLDVERVKVLLAEGANPNARMGKHSREQFQDKWSSGWPVAAGKWTPLLAVANSHREPQPKELVGNTAQALDATESERRKIDPQLIADRNQRRTAVARLLMRAKADLDLHDGYGDTALAQAVYAHYDDLALLLIESGAKVNTKTGIYIDGTGDITPLHRATDRPKLVAALLKRGADATARDGSGETALHWAARDDQMASIRLLIEAGVDVNAKDREGRTALSWVRLPDPLPDEKKDPQYAELIRRLYPDLDKQQAIFDALKKAGAK